MPADEMTAVRSSTCSQESQKRIKRSITAVGRLSGNGSDQAG